MHEVLNDLHDPLQDLLQYVHVSFLLRSSDLDPALQTWPHQYWVKRKNHLPQPLAIVFLMEPGKLLAACTGMEHCWLMISLLSIWTPRFFSEKLLSSCSVPACTHAWTYSFTGPGFCISLCWTFWNYCGSTSPACPSSFEQQNNHLLDQPLLPDLYHLQTFWEHTLYKHAGY